MIPNDVRERVDKLRALINEYRYHYHVLDESIMSEAAADSLKHELSKKNIRSLSRQTRQRSVSLVRRLINSKKSPMPSA